ncbi:MAG: efflux RND transporter periplasmic adaptor subunit [Betaproteobacteria bacterium]|jgi:membrane fusion protein (multidrug efflux system)
MTKRMLIMLGCILVLIAGLAFGFYLHIQKLIASAPKPGAQTVTSLMVTPVEWKPQISSIANLAPVKGVELSSEVSGLVKEVLFKSGQLVKAGDALIQLNAESELAQYNAAQASADLADIVYQRDKAQLAAQGISQAQVDFDLADLKIKRAQAALQKANLEKKTIKAPFSGKLGITAIVAGQYLNPGDKVVTLQTLNPIFADFFQPQQKISQLRIGQTIELTVDAYPAQKMIGKLTTLNPKVDSNSRNIQIQATFDNPRGELLPGMYAKVNVTLGEAQQFLTLPQTAITYNPYGSTVFVIEEEEGKTPEGTPDGKKQKVAKQVFVTTGDSRGDQVAILKGLKAGQEVVTSGQLKLKNGTPVLIDNTTIPNNNPNPKPQEH